MDPVALACANLDQFTPEFIGFLLQNPHVWEAFERDALALVARGIKHYSARAIVHVHRHHTALRQVSGPWKLNDHTSPYLARLWALAHPEHAAFFEYRTTRTRKALP